MKHTKFVPPEFAKGIGTDKSLDTIEKCEKKVKKLAKKWIEILNGRDCQVTEEALVRHTVCWLHGWKCGTRDDSFSFYSESGSGQKSLVIEVFPLRDRQDSESYIMV